MLYSTIQRKGCKCNKERCLPTISYEGWNHGCAPQEVLDRLEAKQKRKTAAKNATSKLGRVDANEDGNRGLAKDYDILDRWFKERRKEMTNCCIECGKYTGKNDDKYFRWSVCHIVPKSLVPSVATNDLNWIELCQQHHQEFDNTFDRAASMMCFGEAKEKFQLFKHLIPPEEMRKINPHLLN